MFCPNCGQDCGNANFCSQCGTQLTQKTNKGLNTPKGATDIPTSSGYLGVDGSVVLSDSAVSICVNSLFKKYRIRIPYDQLTTVIYVRPTRKPKAYGALLFRGKENESVPIPKNMIFSGDHTTITVSWETDVLFYHIYNMLKAIAPPTARFEMIISPTNEQNLKKAAQIVDIDYFFNMYAPHRERAASGIHAKYEIPVETAKALVDKVFDERQKKMYEADPLDAIRDLNLVVADTKRKQQQKNRMDAERRKRQERDDIKSSLERIETLMWLERVDPKD